MPGVTMLMLKRQDGRFPIWTKFTLGFQQLLALLEADMKKLRHDPYELFTRMIQPTIWLLIFGQAMSKANIIPAVQGTYLDYLAPGILAQSVLFVAIFFGIAVIWERDMGILHKLLVTPTPRLILVLARALSAGIRSLSQILIVYLLCFFLDVNLNWNLFDFLLLVLIVILGGAIFATLSLIVAALVKKRERFMGIGQVLAMPLFFASNGLYPISMMPSWLQTFSLVNPLTYQVDALRSLMIAGQVSHFGLGLDLFVCFLALGILYHFQKINS